MAGLSELTGDDEAVLRDLEEKSWVSKMRWWGMLVEEPIEGGVRISVDIASKDLTVTSVKPKEKQETFKNVLRREYSPELTFFHF